ncbi:MAG TPA: hypothetical protein PKD00_02465 [Burkholderiales bacterium]|nr:hypothetical protein [Burkholderiales bacterium]
MIEDIMILLFKIFAKKSNNTPRKTISSKIGDIIKTKNIEVGFWLLKFRNAYNPKQK